MRSLYFLPFLLFLLNGPSFGQATKEDIFNEESELVWLGLDFNKARLVGVKMNEDEARGKYIPRWNGILGLEWNKFNVEEHFGFQDVKMDFERALDRNNGMDNEDLLKMTDGPADALKKKDIEELVKGYKGYSDRDLGLLFVVEQFNKYAEEPHGYIWVSFLDMKSGELLMTERLKGNAGGMGKVNYWINVVYEVMREAKSELQAKR